MSCERFRVDLRELAVRAVNQHQRAALAVIPQARALPEMSQFMVRQAQKLNALQAEARPQFAFAHISEAVTVNDFTL
jgi:hypothetical protein